MAPGVLVQEEVATGSHDTTGEFVGVDRAIFPDGIRTSGQHPPLYHLLQPYSQFPKLVTGPTLWTRDEYDDSGPSRWVHHLAADEIQELGDAADAFIETGEPLVGITQNTFPLLNLGKLLQALREHLLNGKGFVLFKGFPTDAWGVHKSAVAYMGLGAYLGYFLSQNGRGHVLGHVKDVGDDPAQIHSVRIYRTTARQFFHTDDGDIVGLLCLHRPRQGGASAVVSSHHVWNVLQQEHPDVAELLTRPVWYFDRKGEVSEGQEEWTRQPVFYLEAGGKGRVYCKWDPYYVRSLARFSDKGIIPPLNEGQVRALQILEEICQRESVHMILEVGDIQFLSNTHVLHARTAYKAPAPRRHLLRLWLGTPETEGGWRLPFIDSKEARRGGIQVNNTPPVAPLDAE